MDQIYHGCMTKNVDGAKKLIGPGEKCLALTKEHCIKKIIFV